MRFQHANLKHIWPSTNTSLKFQRRSAGASREERGRRSASRPTWLSKPCIATCLCPSCRKRRRRQRNCERSAVVRQRSSAATTSPYMNSAEKKRWRIVLAGPAQKSLERIPPRDQACVRAALSEMETDPFSGDVKYLKGDPRLRRRVGSWRIFFRVERAENTIYISAIERRSSTTY